MQKVLKIIYFSICLLIINLSVADLSHSAEFEVDEIITAIKNEIQTTNVSEPGSLNFEIETVFVELTVVSTVTEKGALAIKIVGYDNEAYNEELTSKTFHKLSFKFQPVGAFGHTSEISLGLVEPITKVKESLKKAYNSPPSYQMKEFVFKLEFAIEKTMDSGIRFSVSELKDLKSRNIHTHYITIYMNIKE